MSTPRSRIIERAALVIALLALVFVTIDNSHRNVLRDGELGGSFRVLARFHLGYVRKNDLSEKEYFAAITSLCEKHPFATSA